MHAKELMIGDLVKVVLTTSHPAETSQNVIEKCTSEKEQIVRCEHVMSNSIAYNKYSEDFKVNMTIPVVEEDIYPIPLTEEILKANGFKDANANNELKFCWYVLHTNQEYGDFWGRTNHEIIIAYRENNSDMYVSRPYADNTQQKISVADIHYVHELQHALRLCGLNELANNFKVE